MSPTGSPLAVEIAHARRKRSRTMVSIGQRGLNQRTPNGRSCRLHQITAQRNRRIAHTDHKARRQTEDEPEPQRYRSRWRHRWIVEKRPSGGSCRRLHDTQGVTGFERQKTYVTREWRLFLRRWIQLEIIGMLRIFSFLRSGIVSDILSWACDDYLAGACRSLTQFIILRKK